MEDALRDRVDKFETKVGPDEGIMMIMLDDHDLYIIGAVPL